MKRAIALVLLVCMFAALSVPAGAAGADIRPNAVLELYSAEGNYTDSIGNVENYSFHVPQLNADTEAAREINAEINERFGEYVASQLKNMQSGYSLWSWNVEWHPYWNENQLFLLVSANLEGDFTDYEAYGYDFVKQCRVTNEMILEQLKISEEDYLENLRENVQFMFEDSWRTVPVGDREKVGYDEAMATTLSWADMDQTMFLNGFGEIETIVKIVSLAGAGWYYHLATPFSYG